MQTNADSIGDGALALVLPFLWLIVVMGAVVINVVARHRNERMNKRIGVELEVIKKAHIRDSPHEALATWINKKSIEYDAEQVRQKVARKHRAKVDNVRYMGYTHDVMKTTKVVTDGSLNGGGVEVVSPPLYGTNVVMAWVKRQCAVLKGVVGLDSSCSTHIHVGLRPAWEDYIEDEYVEIKSKNFSLHDKAQCIVGRAAWAYGYFQSVFNSMVSSSRRNGEWSRNTSYLVDIFPNPSKIEMKSRFWDDSEESYNYRTETITDPVQIGLKIAYQHQRGNPNRDYDARYQCVNPQSFAKYGTIEYRSHQGTLNPTKIQNWSDVLYLLTARCSSDSWTDITNFNGNSFGDLFEYLGIAPSDPLYEAQIRRIRVLNGGSPSVFHNDPQIQLNHLFSAPIVCTNCGSQTCDHDGECGVHEDLTEEITEHFGINPEGYNPNWICQGCFEITLASAITHADDYNLSSIRNRGHYTNMYCPECGDVQSFALDLTIGGVILSLFFGSAPLVTALALIVGCGIGAVHSVGNPFKGLKKLSRRLWKGLSTRGQQAAGFAYEDGRRNNVYYIKAPHSSNALAHRIGQQLNADSKWLMLHTRFATHGENNKANAHPHFGSEAYVTMVHNGVVHNHNDAWMALGTKPTGPVDSQAIAQCLEVGGIEKVVELCEGSMSLIWSDSRDPTGTLKCWTNGGSPLVMGRLDNASMGPVVIASTEQILRKATKKRLKACWEVTVGREYTVLPNGSITKRDIAGSKETVGVVYDWRTYLHGGERFSSSVDPPNFRRIDPKPNFRVKKLAKDEMRNNPAGSFDPIEGKWDGYDACTHEGISAKQWDVKGEPIRYTLPQYLDPYQYDADLSALMRGDHAPPNVDDEDTWDLSKYGDFGYQ